MVENPPANIGDTGSIPGLGGSPGGGNGNPLQYSCLENSVDGGAWGLKESDATECVCVHTQLPGLRVGGPTSGSNCKCYVCGSLGLIRCSHEKEVQLIRIPG